jgi:hypothetical protein
MPNPAKTIISSDCALQITHGAASNTIQGTPYKSIALSAQAIDGLEKLDDLVRRVADGTARPEDGRGTHAAIVVTDFNGAPAQVVAEMKLHGYTVAALSNNVKVSW